MATTTNSRVTRPQPIKKPKQREIKEMYVQTIFDKLEPAKAEVDNIVKSRKLEVTFLYKSQAATIAAVEFMEKEPKYGKALEWYWKKNKRIGASSSLLRKAYRVVRPLMNKSDFSAHCIVMEKFHYELQKPSIEYVAWVSTAGGIEQIRQQRFGKKEQQERPTTLEHQMTEHKAGRNVLKKSPVLLNLPVDRFNNLTGKTLKFNKGYVLYATYNALGDQGSFLQIRAVADDDDSAYIIDKFTKDIGAKELERLKSEYDAAIDAKLATNAASSGAALTSLGMVRENGRWITPKKPSEQAVVNHLTDAEKTISSNAAWDKILKMVADIKDAGQTKEENRKLAAIREGALFVDEAGDPIDMEQDMDKIARSFKAEETKRKQATRNQNRIDRVAKTDAIWFRLMGFKLVDGVWKER